MNKTKQKSNWLKIKRLALISWADSTPIFMLKSAAYSVIGTIVLLAMLYLLGVPMKNMLW